MITVVHYSHKDEADIHYGMTEQSERKVLNKLASNFKVERCSPEEWFGQDNPNYSIHHFRATKK